VAKSKNSCSAGPGIFLSQVAGSRGRGAMRDVSTTGARPEPPQTGSGRLYLIVRGHVPWVGKPK